MPVKPAAKEPSQREIATVIEVGSPSVPAENAKAEKELNFPMKITGDIAEAFEKARSEASLSRRSWVMLAIVEKLKRDGGI
jgi:hypothetical protein